MAEYVDREKIRKEACEGCTHRIGEDGCGWPEPCEKLIAAFTEREAEDVALVVHGKWINEGPYKSVGGEWMKLQECSVCHSVYTSRGNSPWSNHEYCPKCGAKMDLEERKK